MATKGRLRVPWGFVGFFYLSYLLKLQSRGLAFSREPGEQLFDYDEDLAKLTVVYSSASYSENPFVANWTFTNQECNYLTEGFVVNETYLADGTEAFGFIGVDTSAGWIVGSFKGTSTFHDWITDLRTWLHYNDACAPAEGGEELTGRVHFGFCNYYSSLVALGMADRLALLARENPTYSVLLTGHSLGGASAAICAADLTQRLGLPGDRVVLYTIGEPRVGDGVFAEGLNAAVGTVYRLVHNRDVVPHLPPCCHTWRGRCKSEEVCPYHHADEVVYANDMGEGADFVVCNGTDGENYDCDPPSIDLSISDHQFYFELQVSVYCAEDNEAAAVPYQV
ncbi:unnamed protein product [Discosporangium mesarthrocarpum]